MSGDNEKVEFSARVPQKEFDFFKTTFPQYGATNWFINHCLKTFNDQVRNDPSVADVIDKMIEDTLKNNRGENGDPRLS